MYLKELYTVHKGLAHIIGLIGILIIFWLLLAWFSAPSEVVVPNALQHEVNANVYQQQAVESETQANVIRDQRTQAHTETTTSKENLKRRKVIYETTRSNAVSNGISGNDLDTRERKLRSELEELYPR